MLKRLLVIFVMVLSFAGAYATPALAQPAGSTAAAIGDQLQAAAGNDGAALGDPVDPRYVATFIIRTALGLVGTVLFLLNIYAGFLWMTAGGNEEQVAQAKTTIRNATIGLVIVFSAYSITLAVTNLAAGNTLSTGANTQVDPESAAKAGNWSWW